MEAASKALPILAIVNGLSERYGKKYCYPSQVKLLELLGKRLGINMSIATVNRHLRVSEDNGYLRRIRRIRRDEVLGTVFQSTIYIVKRKGYVLLAKVGIIVWDKVRELAAGGKKKVMRGSREEKKSAPEGEVYSMVNHRKRHPGVKLPWNGKGISQKKKPD